MNFSGVFLWYKQMFILELTQEMTVTMVPKSNRFYTVERKLHDVIEPKTKFTASRQNFLFHQIIQIFAKKMTFLRRDIIVTSNQIEPYRRAVRRRARSAYRIWWVWLTISHRMGWILWFNDPVSSRHLALVFYKPRLLWVLFICFCGVKVLHCIPAIQICILSRVDQFRRLFAYHLERKLYLIIENMLLTCCKLGWTQESTNMYI